MTITHKIASIVFIVGLMLAILCEFSKASREYAKDNQEAQGLPLGEYDSLEQYYSR